MANKVRILLYGDYTLSASTTNSSNRNVIGEVEIGEDFSFALSFQNSDIKDIGSIKSSSSKQFNVQATNNNNILFGHIYNIGTVNSSYNQNRKVKCRVLEDSTIIFDGYFQIVKINIKDKTIISYACVITSGNDNLYKSLGDTYLKDLDFSDATHSYVASAITASWAVNDIKPYYYPLLDNGNDFNINDINGVNGKLKIDHFKPATNVKYLIDKIFSTAGKTYTSTILNSTRWRNLIIPFGGSKLKFDSDFINQHKCAVGLSADYTPLSNGQTSQSWNIPLDIDAGGVFYDTGDRWDTTTYEYKPNAYYRIGFYISYELDITQYWYAQTISFSIFNSATNQMVANSIVNTGGGIHRSLDVYLGGANATPTDKFYLKVSINFMHNPPAAGSPAFTLKSDFIASTGLHTFTKFRVEVDPSIQAGNDINLKYALPTQVKCNEFLKSIALLGNLYFEPNPNLEDDYIIESRNDYYLSGGTPVDWTYKVDNSKAVESNLISELYAKQILFTYKKDTDYYNDNYTTRSEGEIYGQKKIDVENDFTKDIKKIEPIFAASPSVALKGSDEIVLVKLGKQDNNQIWQAADSIIRILQKPALGSIPLTGTGINFEGTQINYYPYAGMLDTPFEPDKFDLVFDKPRAYYYSRTGNTVTENNLYNLYWANFIEEATSVDGRIYTFYIKLNAYDISTLRFNRKINIQYQGVDTLFYLNKITDYIPGRNQSCKVELIKVLNLPPSTKSVKLGEGERLANFNLNNNNVNEGSKNGFFGKDNNILTSSNYNLIVGSGNSINYNATFNQINGQSNIIDGVSTRNTILGGENNYLPGGSTGNTIIGSSTSSFELGVTGSTILGLSNFTGTSSNTVYVDFISSNGVLLSQYWTAGTGSQSLIRYPVQSGILGAGQQSIITGGKFNTATTASLYGFIGNGKYNKTAYNFASILNGKNNTANGYHSSIISGSFNYVQSAGSVIIGGQNNYARGQKNTIGNGTRNLTDDGFSFIGNGKYNSGYTDYSFIGNGFQNKTFGSFSTIINGTSNSNNGPSSIILNGLSNLINIQSVNGSNNLIGVGTSNVIKNGQYNIIQNGKSNYVDLLSGTYNSYNSIFNGRGNKIKDTTGYQTNFNSILAGKYNFIYHTSPSTSYANSNSILAGDYHTITNSTNCSILNGVGLSISNDTNLSLGEKLRLRSLTSTTYNYVVADASGQLHITGATPSISGSGSTPNYWEKQGGVGSIDLTGYSASINALSDYSIIAGYDAKINNGDYNGVFAGTGNQIDGNYCSIIGGSGNTIVGSNSINSIINSNASTVNGKDSYELIINSTHCSITGDSGNATIINSKDSKINLVGSPSYFATLIGVSAYTHNNTVSTDHIVVTPKLKHIGAVYSKNTTVSASYTATEWDYLICVKTDAAYTITLPSSPKDGMQLFIKDYYGSASVNNITVDGGSINIDAATTFTMDKDYASLQLLYSSANNQWLVLNYYW